MHSRLIEGRSTTKGIATIERLDTASSSYPWLDRMPQWIKHLGVEFYSPPLGSEAEIGNNSVLCYILVDVFFSYTFMWAVEEPMPKTYCCLPYDQQEIRREILYRGTSISSIVWN